MYRITITMPDGSRGETEVSNANWLEALLAAMARFPEAVRIAATRLPETAHEA